MDPYPDWIGRLLKDVESVLKILAVLVGAVWAYFKFARGRTFRSRLELSVGGTARRSGSQLRVFATLRVRNVGLSQVALQQKGTALLVLEADAEATDDILAPEWHPTAAFPILAEHRWIEPGETIEEQQLILLSRPAATVLRLDLTITAGRLNWSAMSIVPVEDARAAPMAT